MLLKKNEIGKSDKGSLTVSMDKNILVGRNEVLTEYDELPYYSTLHDECT